MPTNDDYFSLARLEQPQMMPEAPIGAGSLAGMMYGQDKARQDQALQGASGLANLRAIMEQNSANETMAGEPGRMANIQRGNALSIANLGNLNNDIQTQSDTSAIKTKEAAMQRLSPYAMGYDPKMSDAEKDSLVDQMQADGINSIGKKDISYLKNNHSELDSLMGATKSGLVNTPQLAQKIMEENVTGDNWVRRYRELNTGRMSIEDLKGQYRLQNTALVAQAKQQLSEMQQSMRPETINQVIGGLIAKNTKGEASEVERETIAQYFQQMGQNAWMRGQVAGPQMNSGALNGDPNATKLFTPPPTLPTPTIPGQAAQPGATPPPAMQPPPGGGMPQRAPLTMPPLPQPRNFGPGQPGPAAPGAQQLPGINPAAMPGPSQGQPQVPPPAPAPAPAPQPAPPAGKDFQMDTDKGEITIQGQTYDLQRGTGKNAGIYRIKTGPLAGYLIDGSGKVVGKQ